MDKNTVKAMIAMVVFFFAVNFIFSFLYPRKQAPSGQSQNKIEEASTQNNQNRLKAGVGGSSEALLSSEEALVSLSANGESQQSQPANPLREILVQTPEYKALFTESGARLKSFTLNNYKEQRVNPNTPDRPVELVNLTDKSGSLPLSLRLLVNDSDFLDLSELKFTADKDSLIVDSSGSGQLTFKGKTSKGLVIERVFVFTPASYLIKQKIRLINQSSGAYSGRLGQTLIARPFGLLTGRYETVASYLDNSLKSYKTTNAGSKLKDIQNLSSADWLGFMNQYFLTAMILSGGNGSQREPSTLALQGFSRPPDGVELVASWPLKLSAEAETVYDFSFFYGPKDEKVLQEAGYSLNQSIDYGWFSMLGRPMAWLLKLFYGLVGNYGLAIIIVTVLIKIALWPLTAKSYKSMKALQKLQPRLTELKEKHKDNREAMSREMMQLYKAYKVNPMGGCLPMLFQIPFFIAFYRVLDYALELRGAPFVLWINDLSSPDRLFHLNFKVPFLDPPTGIPVLTILMCLSMLWQQKMTPQMGDPMQAKIMMFMPLIFGIILLNMPSGLVLYWLVNNLLGIWQQKLINRPEPAAAVVGSANTGGKKKS
ncbi:MAG: membrane protein insertase YidC [Deltaproteobacteria bacterium]|jgi:YidC/Oxa1 family membrane protein insertase|nr:membrane protein insertase YidC [Deltaproteobacteria bacterium]